MAKPTKTKRQPSIQTPEFRVSYPHLFTPNSMSGSKPKYSLTMLYKKDDDLSIIQAALKSAKVAEFGSDRTKWPKNLESPVTDGDNPKYADKEGYKGHWVIKATSHEESAPGVIDEENQPVTDPAVVYPGCYAAAIMFARVWEFGSKQGVQFILEHVKKTRDGKSFRTKKSAAEAFGVLASAENDDDDTSEVDEDFT